MNTKPVNAVILDLGNVVLEWNVEGILGSLDLGSDLTDILRKELFAHQDWLDLDHGKTSEAEVVRGICKRSAAPLKLPSLATAANIAISFKFRTKKFLSDPIPIIQYIR